MKSTFLRAAVLSFAWLLFSPPPVRAQPVQRETRERGATERIVDGDTKAPSTYQLGPDDQITIHALDVPDISDKPQRLDPNGDLRLPMIGRMHAAGMTVEELENELKHRLKEYLREPDVSIAVTELRSQPVTILGAVVTAGVRQLEGRKTLVEMLSIAGGLSADAGPKVRITRKLEQGRIPLPEATEDTSGPFSTVEIEVRPLLEARNPEKNIVVQPYDVISVPRADIVYVVGEIGKPGSVLLSTGYSISVIEAVSASGGVLRTAASHHARILRRVPGEDKRAELNIDLKQIMQGREKDVPLVAGDILIVPDSNGQKAAMRALEGAIQAGIIFGTYGLIR